MPNLVDLNNSNFLFDNDLSRICLQNIIEPITEKQNFIENIIKFELILHKTSGFGFFLAHYQSPKQVFNVQNISISYSYKVFFSQKVFLTPIVIISYETFKYSNFGLKYPSMQSFVSSPINYENQIQLKKTNYSLSTGFKFGSKNNNVTVKINIINISKDISKFLFIYADYQKKIIKSKDFDLYLKIFGGYFFNTMQIGIMPRLVASNIDIQLGFGYNQAMYSNYTFYINPKIKFENFLLSFSYSTATKSHNNGVFEIGIYFFIKRKHKSY